jgi:hypothetical protein
LLIIKFDVDLTMRVASRAIRICFAIALGELLLLLNGCKPAPSPPPPTTFEGAVIRQDTDPSGQIPIEGATVTASNGAATVQAKTGTYGFFRVILRPGLSPGELATLQFRADGYQPLQMIQQSGKQLLVVRMVPIPHPKPVTQHGPEITVSGMRIRYTTKTITTVNIGNDVETLAVANTGNVPCNHAPTCSPDGHWRASLGSKMLDAGPGNEFRDVRVSCIAGPCPFSRTESNVELHEGRNRQVSVLNWSDTVTYLIEAEIYHTMESNLVQQSWPVVFHQTMSFTLPAGSEGATIEADVNGTDIVFPLGPDLYLSWASCTEKAEADRSRLLSCEAKPGYRFVKGK